MSGEGLSIPEAVIGEAAERAEIQEAQPLTDELKGILEGVKPESGYTPDRDRQATVFSNLPQNLVARLHGHLQAAYREQEFFAEKRSEKGVTFEDRAVIAGELFELLVENDPQLNQRSPLSEEFLALMHDPNRFNLADQLGHLRNPDLATFRENELVISSVGEAKLGLLGYRAYQQLRERGFRQGIEETVDVLNGLADPNQHGLREIDQIHRGGSRLEVDSDFKQVLVVPANRQVEIANSLIKGHDFRNSRDYDRFHEILEDRTHLEIKRAAFSVAEVFALTDDLLPQIQARYQKEK